MKKLIGIIGVLLLLTLCIVPANAVTPWYSSGWNYRIEITINSDYIDSDLTNYPILINLSSTISSKCDNNASIVFTDSSNNTLYHEIDYWNTSSFSYIWVNVTSISSTSDTTIYMYYNNSAATDSASPHNVWDSNYIFVCHMNEVLKDSTGTSNPHGYITTFNDSTGIGGSQFINGSTGYIKTNASIAVNNITIDAKYSIATMQSSRLWTGYADRIRIELDTSNIKAYAFDGNWNSSTASYSTGNHITTTIKDNVEGMRVFEDTLLVDVPLAVNDLSLVLDDIYIGTNYNTNTVFFNGTIDEFRISNSTRSLPYINLTYDVLNESGVTTLGQETQLLTSSLQVLANQPNNALSTTVSVTTILGVAILISVILAIIGILYIRRQ